MRALTASPWIKTLNLIRRDTDHDTTRILAEMLLDIVKVSDDPDVAEIFDAYAAELLRSTDDLDRG